VSLGMVAALDRTKNLGINDMLRAYVVPLITIVLIAELAVVILKQLYIYYKYK